ncbi:MAG: ABC transporter permease [Candidatus Dormiibacterota bacterium]
MTGYLVRRLVQAVVVLWVIWTVIFVIYFVVPHDPARLILGPRVPERLVEKLRVSLGLERPIWQQYFAYFGRIFHGDLGQSFVIGAPVTSVIARDIPVDLELGLPAAALWIIVGLGIGILSVRRPGSIRARGATIFIFSLVSTPTFVLGGVLLFISDDLLSGHGIHAFPFPGMWTPLHVNPIAWANNLTLPWITLALVSAAVYARLSRSSLNDALHEDYVRTARAKGLSERRVLYRHALRAALTPLVSQFGIDLAAVLGGLVVVEVVFGIPGLGHQLITAVDTDDLPMIQGIALITSGFVVIANLVVDLLYAVIDPRVLIAPTRV